MFQNRTFLILTGASKGFGQSLACSLAREFSKSDEGKKSVLVLVARCKEGLEETRSKVAQISGDVNVHIVSGDLADVKNLENTVSSILRIADSKIFACSVLINNAGSVGDKIKSIPNHTDVDKIQQYMNLNITSCIYLTSSFLNHFSTTEKYVIHISSLCAIQAMSSLSLYCTGKAARDMFHKVLAFESEDIRVLNYAPGPMYTDMYDDIVKNTDDEDLRNTFVKMKTENIAMKPETSSEKLVMILKQDRYESGAHVDYFDEMP